MLMAQVKAMSKDLMCLLCNWCLKHKNARVVHGTVCVGPCPTSDDSAQGLNGLGGPAAGGEESAVWAPGGHRWTGPTGEGITGRTGR